MNDVVLTTYMTQRPDGQRGTTWPANDDRIVRDWIVSLHKLGLRGVILHDGLSDLFQDDWAAKGVEFLRVKWATPYTPTEERFTAYADWLRENDCDRVLMTDLSDVEFFSNPFDLMTSPEAVYCGSEPGTIGENSFVRRQMLDCYGWVTTPERQVVNPGIIGGYRQRMAELLDDLNTEIFNGGGNPNRDLADFNRIMYRYPDAQIITGYPLHTEFKKYQGPSSGAAIRHK